MDFSFPETPQVKTSFVSRTERIASFASWTENTFKTRNGIVSTQWGYMVVSKSLKIVYVVLFKNCVFLKFNVASLRKPVIST